VAGARHHLEDRPGLARDDPARPSTRVLY